MLALNVYVGAMQSNPAYRFAGVISIQMSDGGTFLCYLLSSLGNFQIFNWAPSEVWYPFYLATRVGKLVGLQIAANGEQPSMEQNSRSHLIAERERVFGMFGCLATL